MKHSLTETLVYGALVYWFQGIIRSYVNVTQYCIVGDIHSVGKVNFAF